MSRTSENLPARRRKKTRTTPSFRLAVLITVLVLVVAAASALMAPGLNVKEVCCEGNVNLSSDEIAAVSQIKTGKNILLANVGKAEREIKKMPFINSVEVKRVLPDKICIRIDERVPAAYVKAGTEGVVIDTEGVILKKLDITAFGAVVSKNTPAPPVKEEKDKSKEDDENKGEKGKSEEQSDNTETAEDGQAEEELVQTEQPAIVYSVPLIEGIELKNTDEGKDARCDDKEKLQTVLEICRAMKGAELLNRATYLDVSDFANIRLIIENRLDVQLGTSDNIEYRSKFLAEVVNTGISAYEKAVVDYRGDDIYVRAPEDGKARTIPKEDEEETDEAADEDTDDGDAPADDEDADSEEEPDSDSEDAAEDKEDGAQIGEL